MLQVNFLLVKGLVQFVIGKITISRTAMPGNRLKRIANI